MTSPHPTAHARVFYATTASNQPHGSGYFEIHASDENAAREAIHVITQGRWSCMYDELDRVHPLDRKRRHGVLYGR